MDWEYVQEIIPRFVHAAQMTLKLSAWGVGGSLLLGVLVALAISYQVRVLRGLARGYVELSRNTPLLIQLFFLYYGLPKIGIHWDGFVCGVIALTFLGGSYMAEALRAGLEALPQALAIALPALTANALFLVKETSVINAVSVAELLFVTKDIIGTDYMTNEALFMLLASYLVLLLPLSALAAWVEKRMRRAEYGRA